MTDKWDAGTQAAKLPTLKSQPFNLMHLEIQSYIGVGPIKFGMTVDEVCKAVGRQPKKILKGPNSIIPTDVFDDFGLHVYYKQPGICEAVEMALPADPIFEGHRLIERPFNQVVLWLQTNDDTIKIDKSGLTSFKFGFGLYAPTAFDQPDASVEAVIVFEKGYYD